MSEASAPLPLVPLASPSARPDDILVSIHLNSNRPRQIVSFLEAIESTASAPSRIEVIVHIDAGDTAMEDVLTAQKARLNLRLRWLATDLIHSFADTWKPYNLLLPMTDPNAYFITLLSDEMLFEEKGWDTKLSDYIGYFPDHIFRLRGSRYRLRNYTDCWECGFAPDSIAFYTRDWLMIQGEWNPCNGPDSFQQCVSFYLFTSDPFSHEQIYRDIPLPHMRFSGEGVSIGMDEQARFRRFNLGTRMWFTLMSHRYQQEAKRRAMLLKAHVKARAYMQTHPDRAVTLSESRYRREITVTSDSDVVVTLPFRLSWVAVTLRNLWRMLLFQYYAGGGRELLKQHPTYGIWWILDAYIPTDRSWRERKDEWILRYYRWRNTKFAHWKAYKEQQRKKNL